MQTLPQGGEMVLDTKAQPWDHNYAVKIFFHIMDRKSSGAWLPAAIQVLQQ